MRQAQLLAPSHAQRVLGPRHQAETITTKQMWGIDATSTVTLEDGFVAIDHCTP
ncbi:MAG: hypothetical protein P0119_09220 [Nitrospira sp.]|nr:hypothetical protein [Nitrospira sp.]